MVLEGIYLASYWVAIYAFCINAIVEPAWLESNAYCSTKRAQYCLARLWLFPNNFLAWTWLGGRSLEDLAWVDLAWWTWLGGFALLGFWLGDLSCQLDKSLETKYLLSGCSTIFAVKKHLSIFAKRVEIYYKFLCCEKVSVDFWRGGKNLPSVFIMN